MPVCRWYAVVVWCLNPKQSHTPAETLENTYDPFSVSKIVGILYGMIELSANMALAFVDVTVATGMAVVSFYYLSVNNSTC